MEIEIKKPKATLIINGTAFEMDDEEIFDLYSALKKHLKIYDNIGYNPNISPLQTHIPPFTVTW